MSRFNPLKKDAGKLPKESVNDIIKKIKDGDHSLKEKFIKDYNPYIIKTISTIMGSYVDVENSEEYSIGLMAFNEAIDHHNPKGNGDFFKYSEMIINHRIIDYIRKNRRHAKVMPFSYFEESKEFEERYLVSNSHYQYENIELEEELLFLEKQLAGFGISMKELALASPKHRDSRELAIKIAKTIVEHEDLYKKMINKKNIPLSDLMKLVNVHRRTVERNRKFIIAVSLIMKSNVEEFKGIFKYSGERRDNLG